MALLILFALMIQPVWPHHAAVDMGRIYANDAQANVSPPAIGYAEEHQGSPWMFPMDELIKDMKERCGLKPEKGPCKAIYDKYYFDPESRKCKKFTWGGCDGVVPFEVEKDCRELCQ